MKKEDILSTDFGSFRMFVPRDILFPLLKTPTDTGNFRIAGEKAVLAYIPACMDTIFIEFSDYFYYDFLKNYATLKKILGVKGRHIL